MDWGYLFCFNDGWVYWWWLFNRVTNEGIRRDLEEFKAKGISGVNLICTGGYAGKEPLPGVSLAGGWTMMGPVKIYTL